jgi:hypothetical protein
VRVIIAGSTDSGKLELADAIRKELPHLSTVREVGEGHDFAVGDLADYRVEAWLASNRTIKQLETDNIIMTHSILDNIVYTSIRLHRGLTNQTLDQSSTLALSSMLATFMFFLLDSFKHDVLFFLPTDDEQSAVFVDLLEEADLSYIVLDDDPKTNATNAIDIIRNMSAKE